MRLAPITAGAFGVNAGYEDSDRAPGVVSAQELEPQR